MQKASYSRSELTGALRLGREDSSIRSLGGDGRAARGGRHRPIRACLQGCEGGRIDVEPLLGVLILVQFGVVVDVWAGWTESPQRSAGAAAGTYCSRTGSDRRW